MDKILIRGGKRLNGEVEVSGSKNAALPILAACLLTDQPVTLSRIPGLMDIDSMLKLIRHVGGEAEWNKEEGVVQFGGMKSPLCEAPYDLVRKMRASVLVLGPMLAKYGKAKVSLPGGCAIGARPINYHLSALKELGAEIELEQGYVVAKANRLDRGRVRFEFPSVGATENLMMTAAALPRETVLENCAREPEIVDLAVLLQKMGAKIEGAGSDQILIQGQASLGSCEHQVMADRIEGGTYLAAGFATGGKVAIRGLHAHTIQAVLDKFKEAGAVVRTTEGDSPLIEVESVSRPKATDVVTAPFPGFPTDMQAQFMAIMCVAEGRALIREEIFENRFMHVPELTRLGADISIQGKLATVNGKKGLIGAPLMATDLRASASLIIGGLCAEGETVVNRIYHLDRGYEKIEKKFQKLGADITRLSD